MEDSRRNFLKIMGSASLFGVGTGAALTSFVKTAVSAKVDDSAKAKRPIRWGMVVDMTKCADNCTKCMDACHVTHNVPEFGNPKDEIKWIWKDDYKRTFPSKNQRFVKHTVAEKSVPTFCNHCDNPPCVRVCPTQATFQRDDGIVEMDFHRCIGCRFCMAGCPYGSRSFNWRDPRDFIKDLSPEYPTREKGVVEKCNFCSERIGTGREPACVETCDTKALIFGNLHDPKSSIREKIENNHTVVRKPELGTKPCVFYIFEGGK